MAVNIVKAVIDGQTYDLSYNDTSKKWEATITAPSRTSFNEPSNKFGVTVIATDHAGNSTTKDRTDATLGGSLQLRVLEKTKPTISLTSPSSGARVISATPQIKFSLRDSGSGVDISSLALKIDSGTAIGNNATGMTATSVSGGYDCVYVPQTALNEGSHNITISITDNDGNISSLFSSSFVVDTMPPALNITSPTVGLITNNKTITVSGSTNDETSSPVIITIKVNEVDTGTVDIANGQFSKTVTLTEGENIINITAKDTAGLTTKITRTVTLDTKAPIISGVSITPNPVDAGKTYVISVTVSDS